MQGMNSRSVDLIYLDPPFNSKANYAAPIGSRAAGAHFKDTWGLDDIKREWIEEIEADNTATWSIITAAGYTHGESSQAYLTYMAIRLLEMRRLLKPTGSIYLHCDPTMSHYLKALLDAIFGKDNFRSEIIWKRSSAHNDAKQGRRQHGRIHDVLLFYSRSPEWTWNPLFRPYDQQYIDRFYRHVEPKTGRRYRLEDLTGPGGAAKGNPEYEVMGVRRFWRYSEEKMTRLIEEGRVVQSAPGRVPAYKRYLDEQPGVTLQDIWSDIGPISSQAKERMGFPTQKPIALLKRIIAASSNPGDVVLDPFCGCATTCVAAELLSRQWAGIDVSVKALDLVIERLQKGADTEAIFKDKELPAIHHLTRPAKRTDADAPKRSRNIKGILFREQQGRCAGKCGDDGEGRSLPLDLFELDHIKPRSKGGPDIDSNLQLLCATCNRKKGSKTMTYLLGLTSQQEMF